MASIRKRACFTHNMEVKQKGKGIFIVQRRHGSVNKQPSDYLACPKCLGWYAKKTYAIHKSKCHVVGGEQEVKLFNLSLEMACSDMSFLKVLGSMRDDEISRVCRADSQILSFGRRLYNRCNETNENYVSTKMRELGRLLLQMRSDLKMDNLALRQALVPAHFDAMVNSTRKLCKFTTASSTQTTPVIPSLALKIGYSTKNCIYSIRSAAIKADDELVESSCNRLLHLHSSEWSPLVSSKALKILQQRSSSKTELPPSQDILVMSISQDSIELFSDAYEKFTAAVGEQPGYFGQA